ncbi:S8 family peptidase [Plantactinospora siamensis]|uniref:S8 family peptidase n=1 Tax=Plantactinospora siamensis TaxID=555372 RepID=A0ABV6NRH0_9ACTN
MTAAVAVSTVTGGGAAAAPPSGQPTELYVVQVKGAPVSTYSGGEAGLAATRPAPGRKIDPNASGVRRYRDHLRAERSAVFATSRVDRSRTVYDYYTAFNGFAIRLTATEATKLKSTPGVVNVWKNSIVSAQTLSTPEFLGLAGKAGVWQRQFGGVDRAGEGVIVGVLDSGFWPENPSFGPIARPRDQRTIDAKWHGACDPGVEAPITCNNKVIGARWYNAAGLSRANPGEFDSPRDFYGHGSHTASTAAGNNGVTATINGSVAGKVSGMAPAARLAIYKVLYANAAGDKSVGSTVDIVAAINQAVEDGVDVLNYSIGDDADGFGPEELAFLNAATAGVFIAASAGNAGPDAGTVDNAMPWQTTVAAGTHDRSSVKTLTLGDGRTFEGVGVGPGAGPAPLVDGAAAGRAGVDPLTAARCVSGGNLDPAKVTGKIVVCVRGVNDRVDKSRAVKEAGGIGMVLYNPSGNSLNADFHFVPSIHINDFTGAVKAYAATAGATATISAERTEKVEAPAVAGFSSRGPSRSSGGDLLKPDIMAPGVDVVAAVAPPTSSGNMWGTNSGTSMASPHIAGIAALLISKNPRWSPMAVKSALMTNASVLDNAGKPIGDQGTGAAATPLDFGAGQVVPAPAFDPGLVYDSGPAQWLQYACGIGVHLTLTGGLDSCDVVGTRDPSDFNSPSLAVGDLAGKQTLSRTVTNVTGRWSVYLAKVKAPAGFTVKVSPPVLVVPPHRSVAFKVTITRTSAAFDQFAFGSLTWRDGRHSVRSPIAVRPVALSAPAEVSGSGSSGSTRLAVTPGFGGTLTATGYGLVPDTVRATSLTPTPSAPFNPDAPAVSPRTGRFDLTVPAGTKVARFATLDADYAAGTDLDMYVYKKAADGSLTQAAVSAGGTAEESVTLTEPGDYAVFVDLFASPVAGGVSTKLHTWLVGAANAGNLTVTPASQAATTGAAATVTVGWSGLTTGQRYLGVVEYGDGSRAVGRTVVSVTP